MFTEIQERHVFSAFGAFEPCAGIAFLDAFMIARDMFIEPAGIEDVAAVGTSDVAMGYYHVLVKVMVRNGFTAFEANHTVQKGTVLHCFHYVRTNIK